MNDFDKKARDCAKRTIDLEKRYESASYGADKARISEDIYNNFKTVLRMGDKALRVYMDALTVTH